MHAKPGQIARLTVSGRPLTRKTDRRPAWGTLVVQSSHGERSTGILRDISTYGCNLVCNETWLRTGIFIALHFSSDRSIQAIVRWVRGGACGIEFLRPISAADAEWLADRNGTF